MKKLFLISPVILLLAFVFINCSGSKDYEKNFYLEYSVKSYTVKYSFDLALKGTTLNVNYLSFENSSSKVKTFSNQGNITEDLYNYLKEVNFQNVKQPEQLNQLDAPIRKLIVNFDSYKINLDLSRVKNEPASVKKLLEILFGHLDKLIPGWRKDSGLE